ncbi:hypothetical protein TNCT_695551 [Trichonephila clavata]|uniref:Uncharacterized protein n=1 Tax=Trichonephila clavata TaxID=2740835 RepID=A0A8X6IKW4_TRICU|nr:hypothetical protein TNCT_695551 [Trichonephila clavata]
MVWGWIPENSCTKIDIFQGGSVTPQRRAEEALKRQVRLFRRFVGPEFLMWCQNTGKPKIFPCRMGYPTYRT